MNKKHKVIWTILIVILTVGLLITGCSIAKDETIYSGRSIFEMESLLRLKNSFIASKEGIEDFIDPSQTIEKQEKLMETVKWDGQFIRN